MNMNEKHSCAEKTADHLYRIGLFAQMNRITVKALRFYEEQGLLLPAKSDVESGYRYYTMSQMETLHRILALKEAGFTIEDMKHLDASGDERSFLLRKKNAILEKIAQLTLQLSRIDGYLMAGGNVLDEPTTGLHGADVRRIMALLESIVDKGNTVIVIEHNTDVMKQADYIIDIGPDGGSAGGQVVFTGTVRQMLENSDGITVEFLRKDG